MLNAALKGEKILESAIVSTLVRRIATVRAAKVIRPVRSDRRS